MRKPFLLAVTLLAATVGTAQAGPPYLSDDPEPTDFQHFEIYAFGAGSQSNDGLSGETGIDFNYGGVPDLQLTTVLPLAYDETGHTGLGNVELAAKYRFLHQEEDGLDLSVFPRIFLPSASHLGDDHAAFLLPLWGEKDFGKWSVFGGGGCTINRGDGSQDFCLGGVAVTREVAEGLRLGVEIFHQGADTIGGKVSTAVGGGLTYDLTANYHLLAYWGPGLQNISVTGRSNSYLALLFTF
jgi:hypothetical protein